ncbi:hypothetical protein GQ600_25449 [Phytophthora cactorum]|nr:hypothetical protein GQ600_25449 [Phytophthora cactorum]
MRSGCVKVLGSCAWCKWLKMMSESPHSFNVETIDMVFVAEQDQLSAFEFKKVTGEELVKGV